MRIAAVMMLAFITVFAGCKSSPFGERVRGPFEGSKYESNRRFYRAVGQGQSRQERIALQRAQVRARAELAAQADSRIKELADDYISETTYENKAEITGKFQSLTRAITDTQIGELRKIGERKYVNEAGEHTAFVAYEIRRKDLYEFLQRQAKLNPSLSPEELRLINEMLDFQVKRLEDGQ